MVDWERYEGNSLRRAPSTNANFKWEFGLLTRKEMQTSVARRSVAVQLYPIKGATWAGGLCSQGKRERIFLGILFLTAFVVC